jgi:glycosyltransferase involved in cell wall biosynthesis
MNPRVTIFIPAYHEVGNFAHCVEVMLSQSDELATTEGVIRVDEGSLDDTP